jgi:spermidine synthase
VQWAPSARAVETFASVFPYVKLLLPGSVLIGSDRPIAFDRAALAERFAEPGIAAHLRRGNPAGFDFASLFAEEVVAWLPATPRVEAPLTDVFPRDEFYLNNPVVAARAAAQRPPGQTSGR